jgi:hypothetical protein
MLNGIGNPGQQVQGFYLTKNAECFNMLVHVLPFSKKPTSNAFYGLLAYNPY